MLSATTNETTPTAKQIVFLFMAATVVAVVVFLCGVLVGRGVPTQVGASGGKPFVDQAIGVQDSGLSEVASENEMWTYPGRLLDGNQGDLDVIRPVSIVGSQPQDLDGERFSAPELSEHTAPGATVDNERFELAVSESLSEIKSTDGFSVQVMALSSRAAAQEVVTRLSGKGFQAFVVLPEIATPSNLFRVRVGPYADRSEAQLIMKRLESEEQLEAFVTR